MLKGAALGGAGLATAAVGHWFRLGAIAAPPEAGLARYPYVQNLTPSAVTILWHTDLPSEGRLEYGTTTDYGLVAGDGTYGSRHQVTLTGLSSGTTYRYRVVADGLPLTEGDAFRSATGPCDFPAFSFVVLGDSGSGEAPQ